MPTSRQPTSQPALRAVVQYQRRLGIITKPARCPLTARLQQARKRHRPSSPLLIPSMGVGWQRELHNSEGRKKKKRNPSCSVLYAWMVESRKEDDEWWSFGFIVFDLHFILFSCALCFFLSFPFRTCHFHQIPDRTQEETESIPRPEKKKQLLLSFLPHKPRKLIMSACLPPSSEIGWRLMRYTQNRCSVSLLIHRLNLSVQPSNQSLACLF